MEKIINYFETIQEGIITVRYGVGLYSMTHGKALKWWGFINMIKDGVLDDKY